MIDIPSYPKIQTLFERDPKTRTVIEDRLSRPEFGIVKDWVVTEKVDGTNVRLHWDLTSTSPIGFHIGGRNESAQIPAVLNNVLLELCTRIDPEVRAVMAEHELTSYTLFGEGFGARVHPGGGRYGSLPRFALFDVLVGGRLWLSEDVVSATAARLSLERVPTVLVGNVAEAIDLMKQGYASDVAEPFDASFHAEGVVAKTAYPLCDNRGERVMWKLKTRDFR